MDRASLELFLSNGLSLAEIGGRVGRDPSTVGYWVKKHGLTAVNRDRVAPRGGLQREQLELSIGEGESIATMAAKFGVSPHTVRYWLARFGLQTEASIQRRRALAAKRAGLATLRRTCKQHGETDFFLEGRGYYRCLRCRSERVATWRRRAKAKLVHEAGGKCVTCGYDRYVGALHFHHVDPDEKRFGLSRSGSIRSMEALRREAKKCVLLCSNCHAEVEAGVAVLPLS
jgi:transposase